VRVCVCAYVRACVRACVHGLTAVVCIRRTGRSSKASATTTSSPSSSCFLPFPFPSSTANISSSCAPPPSLPPLPPNTCAVLACPAASSLARALLPRLLQVCAAPMLPLSKSRFCAVQLFLPLLFALQSLINAEHQSDQPIISTSSSSSSSSGGGGGVEALNPGTLQLMLHAGLSLGGGGL
jgi:hypothetical protein